MEFEAFDCENPKHLAGLKRYFSKAAKENKTPTYIIMPKKLFKLLKKESKNHLGFVPAVVPPTGIKKGNVKVAAKKANVPIYQWVESKCK